MSRTETRRVDISCTRDKNVPRRARMRHTNENGSVVKKPRARRHESASQQMHLHFRKDLNASDGFSACLHISRLRASSSN